MRTALFISGIALLLYAGCKPAKQEAQLTDDTVNIRVQSVEFYEYKIPVRASGMLSTRTEMKLSFKTGGLISQINVREGASVEKGEILAILDLSEVKANVKQAQIGYDKAQRDLNRARNLYTDSVATLEQYQDARSAFELARSRKQIAEFNLLHSIIKAPTSGRIQKILVERNEMIAPGYPAILFASTENDWIVRVALTDKDIVKLAIGDSAHITMDAFPGNKMISKITELGSIADPVTGTYEVELMLLQVMPQFRTGFISRADIYPDEVEKSILLPLEALLDANDNTAFVYAYKNGKTERQRIRTGPITNNAIVVLEGLNEGDTVVTTGVTYLGKDSEVRLIEKP